MGCYSSGWPSGAFGFAGLVPFKDLMNAAALTMSSGDSCDFHEIMPFSGTPIRFDDLRILPAS